MPASEQKLCRYVSFLAQEGLAPSSIKLYLSAVRHLQISLHLPDPKIKDMARLEQVVKGTKSVFAKHHPGTRKQLPITPELLLKIRQVWEREAQNQDNIMLWAAACLCYFGFLRAGELSVSTESSYDEGVHLNVADISFDKYPNPSTMRVKIKASKTDPFRQGIHIFMARTYKKLCPIEAMVPYLACRGQSPGMLFKFQDGRLLTHGRFVDKVREALDAAGITSKHYAGHSFRAGAATTAAQRGVPEAIHKTQQLINKKA